MLYLMIHPTYEAQLRNAWATAIDPAVLAALEPVAAEPLVVVNRVAKINIKGVLVKERDRFLDMFGIAQTSYAEIAAHIREAEGSGDVREVEFHVDSPGGMAGNGLVDTAELMARMIKPNRAVVGEMAASAAYWLAAQAQSVALAGAATSVGSIGVAVDIVVRDDQVSIASTDAPRKRPDVRTARGQEDVRRGLDDLHALFVAAVARGRGVDAETVNKRFGQGGMLLASEAIDVGMADTLLSAGPPPVTRATIAAMDLDTLKREHPALYASVVALGVKGERDRVCAHLTLAKASGDVASATTHITEGREVDSTVTAAHAAANMNAVAEAARIATAPPPIAAAPPVAPGVAPPPVAPSAADQQLKADIAATFEMAGYSGT